MNFLKQLLEYVRHLFALAQGLEPKQQEVKALRVEDGESATAIRKLAAVERHESSRVEVLSCNIRHRVIMSNWCQKMCHLCFIYVTFGLPDSIR